MHNRQGLGRFGERVAARCLVDQGLVLLDTNWRCSCGEIDIIATDGDALVICEVKTRSTDRFGDPSEAVGPLKAQRLRRLALHWMAEQPRHWPAVRFDVVSIVTGPGRRPLVRHLRGVL
jgi:putative endonuclease